MHVHIGSISDAIDDKGSSYKTYDFYLNGTYHCSLRYSQLLDLHNQLKTKYSMTQVTPFPPKRFRMSDYELLERKGQLEKYLHCVLQDNQLGLSTDVVEYLLAAQLASCGIDDKRTELDVYLCNGRSTTVSCSAHDSMPQVLETLASSIGLEPQLIYYFVLMLEYQKKTAHDSDDTTCTSSDWTLLRALRDFEAPYVSLSVANNHSTRYEYRLALRKWFFEPSWVTPILESNVALNMLYIEVVSDLEGTQWTLAEENKKSLTALKKTGKRKKCVETAATMVAYGYRHCGEILVEKDQKANISIGGLEAVMEKENDRGRVERKPLPISKMRSWRVGVLNQSNEHFISIEYEQSRNKFTWFTMRGVPTILFTQCLNLAVQEFIIKRTKGHVRKPGDVSFPTRPSVTLPTVQFTSSFPRAEDIDPLPVVTSTTVITDSNNTRTLSSSSSQNGLASREPAAAQNGDEEPDHGNGGTHTSQKSTNHPEVAITRDSDDEETTGRGGASISSTAIAGIGSALSKVATGIKGLKLQGLGSGKAKQQEQESLNPTFVSDDDL